MALLILCLLSSAAMAAETDTQLKTQRFRQGVFAGAQLVSGQLGFQSASAQSDIQLTAMPAVLVGADLWPTEGLGLYATLSIGAGAQISGVLGNDVHYNLTTAGLGVRSRWFLGPRSTATTLGLGAGGRFFHQFVQEQRPSVLIDRHIIGPELQAFATQPFRDLGWVRVAVHAGMPFFVRESPTDTGDPKGFYTLGAQLSAAWHLTEDWALQVIGRYDYRFLNFKGEGTRAAGITQGRTEDSFFMWSLAARYALDPTE